MVHTLNLTHSHYTSARIKASLHAAKNTQFRVDVYIGYNFLPFNIGSKRTSCFGIYYKVNISDLILSRQVVKQFVSNSRSKLKLNLHLDLKIIASLCLVFIVIQMTQDAVIFHSSDEEDV